MIHWKQTRPFSFPASGFPPPSTFDLPHSLTTLEDKGLVCVADRQNGRIQCFDLDGKFVHEMHPGGFAGNIYGVQYRQANGMSDYSATSQHQLLRSNILTTSQGCHWSGKSQGNSRSGKSRNFVLGQGNLRF